NPLYVEDNGETVYFTMSLWDPYDVYLAKVTLDIESATLPGDFDFDGDVDGHDFLAWQRDPNLGDLADWQANYGATGASASVAVPEPSTFILCGIAVCCWWRPGRSPLTA